MIFILPSNKQTYMDNVRFSAMIYPEDPRGYSTWPAKCRTWFDRSRHHHWQWFCHANPYGLDVCPWELALVNNPGQQAFSFRTKRLGKVKSILFCLIMVLCPLLLDRCPLISWQLFQRTCQSFLLLTLPYCFVHILDIPEKRFLIVNDVQICQKRGTAFSAKICNLF